MGRAQPSIDDLLAAFLAEQRARLSARTYRNYGYVVELLGHCLNGYAYQSLTGLDLKRWRKAFDGGDEDAFRRLFGAEHIVENLGEFLGYFMVRKVIAGQELTDPPRTGLPCAASPATQCRPAPQRTVSKRSPSPPITPHSDGYCPF